MWIDGGPAPIPRRTLVVGLGNPILGDDGVGWRVVEEAAAACRDAVPGRIRSLRSMCLCGEKWSRVRLRFPGRPGADGTAGGLRSGHPRGCDPDSGRRAWDDLPADLDDLPTLHADSAHDASLTAALALGRRLGAHLPASQEITIVAVEAENVLDFGEDLSPSVAASVGRAAELVLAEFGRRQAPGPAIAHP